MLGIALEPEISLANISCYTATSLCVSSALVEKLRQCSITPNIAMQAGLIKIEAEFKNNLDQFEMKVRGLDGNWLLFSRKVA